MRPVTGKEYKRMQQQTESRLAGRSEIAFGMLAKESGESAVRWLEEGYICDFHIPRFSERTKTDQGPYSDPAVEAIQYAVAKMPMRYVTNDAFTVKSPDAVAEPWFGDVFGVTPFVSVGTINLGTEFSPIVEYVVLMNYDDMVPEQPRAFSIVSQPYLQADGFMLELTGIDTGTYIGVNWGRFDRADKRGYGYVDGYGNVVYFLGGISDRNGSLKGTTWTNGSKKRLR